MSQKSESVPPAASEKRASSIKQVKPAQKNAPIKLKTTELLPSDGNDNADISPRIAFLAYN